MTNLTASVLALISAVKDAMYYCLSEESAIQMIDELTTKIEKLGGKKNAKSKSTYKV